MGEVVFTALGAYVFLSNEMDASDDMIRRVSENKLLPIESDEEYLNVIKKMFN